MKIKLSEWASVAEILGAVAIVISLFFVGFQISDGNNETRAATTQAALDAEMAFQAELLRYADVWEKSVLGGDLTDEVERRRAIALYNMAMTSEDNRYQMGSSGYLEYSDGALRQLVTIPFYEIWRVSIGASGRSPEFLTFIDDLRNSETTE